MTMNHESRISSAWRQSHASQQDDEMAERRGRLGSKENVPRWWVSTGLPFSFGPPTCHLEIERWNSFLPVIKATLRALYSSIERLLTALERSLTGARTASDMVDEGKKERCVTWTWTGTALIMKEKNARAPKCHWLVPGSDFQFPLWRNEIKLGLAWAEQAGPW
jgi:hypothetical protein